MDQATDAFRQALQAQTDTLLAIALIIGFAAIAIVIWRVTGLRQNKITVPATEPGEPDKTVTKDEFIMSMFTDYREQLKVANNLNEVLATRLKEADATNIKMVDILDRLGKQNETSAKANLEAMATLGKAINAGTAQARTIRDEAINAVVGHVDTKLAEMEKVRQELINSIQATEKRIEGMSNEIRDGHGTLIERMNEVINSLEKLTRIVATLSETNKETLESNKMVVTKLTESLTEIQSKLLEILSEVIVEEKPNVESNQAAISESSPVSPVAGPTASPGTSKGTPSVPEDHGPTGGSSVIQGSTDSGSGSSIVATGPSSNVPDSSAPGTILRPSEGSTGGSKETGRHPSGNK